MCYAFSGPSIGFVPCLQLKNDLPTIHFIPQAIADLAAREDKPLEGFGVFGVVKETGVDDQGIVY